MRLLIPLFVSYYYLLQQMSESDETKGRCALNREKNVKVRNIRTDDDKKRDEW